jgi:hypothetical protein
LHTPPQFQPAAQALIRRSHSGFERHSPLRHLCCRADFFLRRYYAASHR